MILVQLTISATTYYISDEYCYLTHQYNRKIKNVDPPRYATRSPAGGYVEVEYGSIVIDPSFFAGNWPPPKSIPMTIKITDSTEAAAVTIFDGTAHRSQIAKDGITYAMHGTEYDSVISSSTYIDDTLLNVFTTYCGASYLNLTLNHTYDRATSPGVYAHVEKDTPIIDMLSTFAEATNHLFYIKGSTLYLVDMQISNGSAIEPGGRFYPPEYTDLPPYKQFASDAVEKYSIDGTYSYGKRELSDIASSIEHIYGRVGDNSGDDSAWLLHEIMLPYESGKYYMSKIKFRRSSGAGYQYFGLLGYASNRSTIVDRNGGTNYTLPCWHCISNRQGNLNGWLTYTGYSRNWANPGSSGEAPSISSPGTLYDDGAGTRADYFRPIMLINYNAQTGEIDIDFVAFYEVDSSGNILETLFFDDFCEGFSLANAIRVPSLTPTPVFIIPQTPGFSSNWVRASGSGERETITSVTESKTNVEAQLTIRKAILESPRMTIKLDLTAANMPEPGQSITWTDEIISPDGAVAVSCEIKARNISFDLDGYKVIIEGEGSIT